MRRFVRSLFRLLLVAAILAAVIAAGLYVYRLVSSYHYDGSLNKSTLDANAPLKSGITNIALFGLDTRSYNDGTRSDCIMILTVDGTRGKLKLTSLMRDSLVEVPDHGETKLTHAYAYGGAALSLRTINDNFGTDITDYVAVDFDQLKVLIDLVGGVNIDVSESERREANIFIREYCKEKGVPKSQYPIIRKAGYQKLTGVPAMCYARIRKGGTGDDWGRVERQGKVMEAMFSQVHNLSTPQLLALVQKFLPYVTTSLSPTAIVSLAASALRHGKPTLEHTRVPLDGEWKYSRDGTYIEYDLTRASDLIRDYIYNDVTPEPLTSSTTTKAAA